MQHQLRTKNDRKSGDLIFPQCMERLLSLAEIVLTWHEIGDRRWPLVTKWCMRGGPGVFILAVWRTRPASPRLPAPTPTAPRWPPPPPSPRPPAPTPTAPRITAPNAPSVAPSTLPLGYPHHPTNRPLRGSQHPLPRHPTDSRPAPPPQPPAPRPHGTTHHTLHHVQRSPQG